MLVCPAVVVLVDDEEPTKHLVRGRRRNLPMRSALACGLRAAPGPSEPVRSFRPGSASDGRVWHHHEARVDHVSVVERAAARDQDFDRRLLASAWRLPTTSSLGSSS